MNNFRTQINNEQGETDIQPSPLFITQKSKSEDRPMESLKDQISLRKVNLCNFSSLIHSEIQNVAQNQEQNHIQLENNCGNVQRVLQLPLAPQSIRNQEIQHRSLSQEEQLLMEFENFESDPKINEKVQNSPSLKPNSKGSYRMNKNKKPISFKSGFRQQFQANSPENENQQSFFSAQPKLLNLDFVHEQQTGGAPVPLSFKRNGHCDSEHSRTEKKIVPDEDKSGKYFGASIRRGPHMSVQEDRYTYKENFQGSQTNAFYAVFDGHAGQEASDFCCHNIHKRMENISALENDIAKQIQKVCKSLDDEFLQFARQQQPRCKAGSTLLLSLIQNGRFTIANIGDSSGMLLKQNGKMLKLTDEQTPNRDDEYNRIVRNNGFVSMKNDVARVDGSLAVSRAIGDIQYKQYVIPQPETYNYQIQPNDDLLILSTDGLYLVFSEQEVAQKISEYRRTGKYTLKEITKMVTEECCTNYYCKDNVTLIIIDLKKHYADFQNQIQKQNSTSTNYQTEKQRRYHSQVRLGGPLSNVAGNFFYNQNQMTHQQMQSSSYTGHESLIPQVMGQHLKQHWSPQLHQQALIQAQQLNFNHQTSQQELPNQLHESPLIKYKNPKLMMNYQHPYQNDLFNMSQNSFHQAQAPFVHGSFDSNFTNTSSYHGNDIQKVHPMSKQAAKDEPMELN